MSAVLEAIDRPVFRIADLTTPRGSLRRHDPERDLVGALVDLPFVRPRVYGTVRPSSLTEARARRLYEVLSRVGDAQPVLDVDGSCLVERFDELHAALVAAGVDDPAGDVRAALSWARLSLRDVSRLVRIVTQRAALRVELTDLEERHAAALRRLDAAS